MIISKDGRLFGKINVADFLIIIVIVAIIAGAAYKFGIEKLISSKESSLSIQLYQEEVPDYVANSIKVGDKVIEDVQNAVFGNVVDIKTDKSVSWAQNQAGEYIASTKKGYSSITVTVSGKGKVSESGVIIGSGKYYIGKSLVIKIANTVIAPRVSDIRRAD